MADNLPPIVGRLVGDTSDFSRKMSGARTELGGFNADVGKSSSMLGGMGKAAALAGTAFAAIGVGNVLKNAIMGASDLAETVSKVNVVYGQSAKEVEQWAGGLAKSFGLPKREMLDAAASFGLIGKAAGQSQGEAAKMSTQLGKLAADASSFYNVPLPEALQAIQSGLVGEAEPMRRFGVLLNEAAVKEEAYASGIAKRGAELTEAQKVQARSALIMKGMTDASGDLERTQGSLANRIREMKGRAENFATSVGTVLLPVVLKAFDVFEKAGGAVAKFGGFISKGFQEGFGGQQRSGVEAVGRSIGLIPKLFSSGFREMDVTSDGFNGKIEQLGLVARKVFDGIKSFVTDNRATWEQWGQKLGAIISQIGGVLSSAFTVITTVIGVFVSIATDLWDRFGRNLLQHIGTALNNALQIFRGVFQIIKGVLDLFVAIFTGDWGKAWEAIKSILAGVWNVIVGILKNALNTISTLIGVGMAVISAIWSFLWNSMKTLLSDVWELIKTAVGTAIAWIGERLEDLVGWFLSLPGRVWSAAMSLIDKLWDLGWQAMTNLATAVSDKAIEVIEWFGGLPGRIWDALGDLGSFLLQAGKNLIEGLISGIKNMAGAAADAAKNVVTGAIKSAWNAIVPGSPSKVGTAIGLNFGQGIVQGIVQSQSLVNAASAGLMGGVVQSAGGSASGAGAVAGGSGAAQPVTIILQVGSKEVARALIDDIATGLVQLRAEGVAA